MALGLGMLLAACGVPGEKASHRGETAATEVAAEDTSFGLLTADQLASVVQIQIEQPYCRIAGTGIQKQKSYCAGTFLDATHVLTSAHCVISECPSQKVALTKIRIPTTRRTSMTGFGWADADVRYAMNVTVVQDRDLNGTPLVTTVGSPSGKAYIGKITVDSTGWVNTGTDLAVIRFQSGATGYKPAAMRKKRSRYNPNTPAYNGEPYYSARETLHKELSAAASLNSFVPVAFSVTDKPQWELKERAARPLTKWLNGYGGLANDSFGMGISANAGDVGCQGDSGSPLFLQGQVVAVAAAARNPTMRVDYPCAKVSNITYIVVEPDLINEAVKASNGTTLTTATSTVMSLDLWAANAPNGSFIDATARMAALQNIATFTNPHATTNASGAAATWTVQGTSTVSGGVSDGTSLAVSGSGTGKITATWVIRDLEPGNYQFEIIYPTKLTNSKCVKLFYRAWDQLLADAQGGSTPPTPPAWQDILGATVKVDQTLATPGYGTGFGAKKITPAKLMATSQVEIKLADNGCATGTITADTVKTSFLGN